ncbi:hypothetical protein C8F01DRAFT_1157635 [Mycena amicta]|nr:hypothetical protein C8F01DRAFT_1157635 [Mycena amicta]
MGTEPRIHTLPFEILAEIFEFCLPPHPSLPNPATAPLLVAQICQRWREIALSSPRLWSFISLAVKKPEPGKIPRYGGVAHTDLWLLRAAERRLSIAVHIETPLRLSSNILEALAARCARWENVVLCITQADLLAMLILIQDLLLPALHTIALDIVDSPRQDITKYTFPFLMAPRLSVVRLSRSFIGFLSKSGNDLPITLSALEYVAYSPDEVTRIMSSFPALRHLITYTVSLETFPSSPLPPLRSLMMHNFALRLPEGALPSLTDLTIQLKQRNEVVTLCDFLFRSGCVLAHLGLHVFLSQEFVPAAFQTIFAYTPALSSLCLTNPAELSAFTYTPQATSEHSFFCRLFSTDESPTKLPSSLRHLSITEVLMPNPYPSIAALVQCQPNLESLRIASSYPVVRSAEVEPRPEHIFVIDAARAGGMRISTAAAAISVGSPTTMFDPGVREETDELARPENPLARDFRFSFS